MAGVNAIPKCTFKDSAKEAMRTGALYFQRKFALGCVLATQASLQTGMQEEADPKICAACLRKISNKMPVYVCH
jgi:hypothetical protein